MMKIFLHFRHLQKIYFKFNLTYPYLDSFVDPMIFKYAHIHALSVFCVRLCAYVHVCECECESVYGLLIAQSMMPLSISNHCEKLHSAN